jgi:hypothetical protein
VYRSMTNSRIAATQLCLGLALLMATLLSGCGVIASYPLTSASLGVWGTTGKTPTDHLISEANGQDCELIRGLIKQPLCTPTQLGPVQIVDKTTTRLNAPVVE